MIVKVCGVKSIDELEVVEKYADYTGVVVECESKRRVELELAKEIISSSSIPVFAVSTVSSLDKWLEIVSRLECNLVQVHGDMNLDDFELLKDHVKVMKAFIVNRDAESIIRDIKAYSPHLILLDSGRGSGKVHDWEISRKVAEKYGIILAGGLNVENVRKAIEVVNPIGVDVSSGVEVNGVKDESLVSEFVRRAKNEVR